jgi:hypothetical protein
MYSFDGGTTTISSSNERSQVSESFSLLPVIGAQLEIVPRLWAGFGFGMPSIPVTGSLQFNAISSGNGIESTTGLPLATSSTSRGDLLYSANEALRLNLGVAYDARDSFSFAADVVFYAERITSQSRGVTIHEDKRSGDIGRRYNRNQDRDVENDAVIDFSLGAEVALLQSVALRGGFFTDLGASSPIRDNLSDVDRLRLDRYGGTLGLGFAVGSFDTTAGVMLVRGEGEFGVLDPVTTEVVGVESTETTAMLVLSGAVTVEEAKRKIRETLPFDVPVLPDLGTGAAPPAPRVPTPLPPESKPPPPALKSRPPPPLSPVDSTAPASGAPESPATTPAPPAGGPVPPTRQELQ